MDVLNFRRIRYFIYMKKVLILILIVFVTNLPVFSSEWLKLSDGLFLDTSSVRYVPKHRSYKAWVKEVSNKGIVLFFNEYNLKEYEWRNLDKVIVDDKNNILKREFNNHVGLNWLNVVPDTHSSLEHAAIKKHIMTNSKFSVKELHVD